MKRERRTWWQRVILLSISAFLLFLAQPKISWDPLIWIGLIPFFLSIEDTKWWKAILYGELFGTIYFILNMYWVAGVITRELPSVIKHASGELGILPFILLCVIEGISLALFAFIYWMIRRWIRSKLWSVMAIASSWVVIEYVRGFGQLGFTGGRLSDAIYRRIGLIQTMSFTGIWFILFLIVLINAIFFFILKSSSFSLLKKCTFIIGVFVLIYASDVLVSSLLPPKHVSGSLKVALVQPNISPYDNYNLTTQKLENVVRKALKDKKISSVSLVVFPESVIIDDVKRLRFGKELEEWANTHQKDILLGYLDDSQNVANLIKVNKGFQKEYAKTRLVPFSEFIPNFFPFSHFKFLMIYNFKPGDKYVVYKTTGGKRISVMICFESFFSSVARRLVNNGSQILFVITNDGWFGKSSALEQHLVKGIYRAVENRRPFLQCAHTGISAEIDKYGRIIARTPIRVKTILNVSVDGNSKKTFYTTHGDWFVGFAFILSIVSFVIDIAQKRKM